MTLFGERVFTVICKLTRPSKCDERLPCSHCVNRGEKCERPPPRPPQVKAEVLQRLSGSQHVNTLHIEMFYHFEKVTKHTLQSPEIWELMIQLSFEVGLSRVTARSHEH